MTGQPVTYVIDGARIHTLDDVFTVVGERYAVKAGTSAATWMRSPTASPVDTARLMTVVSSSYGRTATDPARPSGMQRLRVSSSSVAQCHPTNRERVRADLERALREDGPTAFDWVVGIFEFRDVRLDLR
nr:ribonuclease inhibitor [Rhodococcus sp. JVH1]